METFNTPYTSMHFTSAILIQFTDLVSSHPMLAQLLQAVCCGVVARVSTLGVR